MLKWTGVVVLLEYHMTVRLNLFVFMNCLNYANFDRFRLELLLKVISGCSEHDNVIVTTNLAFSHWTELFESTAMVVALVERLIFKYYVLDMNRDSYSLE